MRTFSRSIVVFASITLATDCATDLADKGEEDAVPVDGKADSFASPVEHGQIVFGIASNAAIADQALFHARSFALVGQADVHLQVAPKADNFDTVMYLYKRSPGSRTNHRNDPSRARRPRSVRPVRAAARSAPASGPVQPALAWAWLASSRSRSGWC